MPFRIEQLNVLNLATVGNSITAGSFVKSGGTSSQFLKADGSVDTNAYITGITSGMVTTALGYTPVPNTRNITINGVTQDLSVDRSWTISVPVSSVSGSGAGISVSPTTGAVVVSNTGVTSNVAGTGISVSGATGAVTITNTGVTSIVAGTAISISGATGAVTINNTGVTSLNGGTGAITGIATTAQLAGYLPLSGGTITGTLGVNSDFSVNATRFTVNAATGNTVAAGSFTANSIIKSGGTSSQFLKADGSIDSNSYITSASVGNGTLTLAVSGSGLSGSASFTANQSGSTTFTVTSNATTAATANTLVYRDASGHITGNYGFFAYVNTSDNDETGITRFVIKNGDNYHRSATTTTAMTVIRGVASGTWGIDVSGNSATTSQTNFTSLTVNSNTVLHAGNYNSYAPTLTGTGASGTWSINITGSAGSASSASSVPWTGVTAGTRNNYNLLFQPPSNSYAGFEFTTSTGGGGGYFLIRGTSDTDVYTAEGITLVADAGWLTLAQRTQSNKGVRIMTGATSTTRLSIDSAGISTFSSLVKSTATDEAFRAQSDGTSTAWRGRVGSFNATADKSSFLGNYTGRPGVFGHNNALTGWAELYVNTLGVYGHGTLYLSWDTYVKGNGNDTNYPILHSGNYNSYSPTLTGGGASGTWGISISGNAATATNADTVDGFHASQSTVANNVVVRDANGYIFGNYINMTDDGNPGGGTSISSFITKQGDNYYRSVSPTNAMVSIRGVASGSWGINISGNSATTSQTNFTTLTLNSATVATQSWVTSQGYITGNQTITLSGDVSGSGTTSISVTVNQIDGWSFVNTGSNSGTAADSINSNGISYVSANISLFGQTDGALYSQAYSSSWQHQIYGDYRTGQIAIRGKNSGTWQSWRTVLDSSNYTSYVSGSYVPISGGINMTGSYGLNDNKLYLRTNGDNNHYLWNAGDDWEELNAYEGTGFRITSVSGSVGVLYVYGSSNGGYTYSPYSFRAPIFYDSANTSYYCDPASTSVLNTISSYTIYNTSLGSGYYFTAGSWGWRHQTPSGYIEFGPANGSYAHIYTDRSSFYFNVNDLYANGNLVLTTGNYASYVIPIGGGWYGSGLPGSRWYGYSVSGGEFVLGNGLPNAGQVGVLIDGCYVAGENNGYWSMDGSNAWSSRRGWYWDGSYLNFTTNSPTSLFTTLRLANGFELQQGGSNYGQFNSWVHLPGFHGLYSGQNSAHIYPNNGTYGSWMMSGSRNGWQGIEFNSGSNGNITLMVHTNSNESGFHNNSYGWQIFWSGGALYSGRNTYGGNTSRVLQEDTWINSKYFGSDGYIHGIRFVDANDSSYYLDPASTSELNSITTGTRARWGEPRIWTNRQAYTSDQNYWTGTNGWGTSEGNWDNAWKGGFSGWDIWGTGTAHPQGSGYIHAQGIVSGQHYAASDGSSGYGWMMVGAADATANRYWLRGKWGGTTSGWVEMITSGNIGSQNVNYASQAGTASFASNSGNTNSVSNATGGTYTWTGINYFRSNLGGYCGGLSNPPLQVYSDSNNSAFFSFHKGGYYAVNMGLDADSVLRIGGWSAGSNRWQLDMSGNMTVAGDVTAYSDARVKENVETVEDALDKVLNLRGVYYNRTDSDDKRRKVGVIAQEILEVIPEVVGQDNDGMYNVSYGNIVGVLIEAIKEQQKQIDELKARLD